MRARARPLRCRRRSSPRDRAGIKTLLIPKTNEKDLAEIPEEVRADLEFILVENMDEVLEHALDRPIPEVAKKPAVATGEGESARYAH